MSSSRKGSKDTTPLLVIKNLEAVVQVCNHGELLKNNNVHDELAMVCRREDGVGACLVVSCDGLVFFVGHDDQLGTSLQTAAQVIDGQGCCIIPGLIDAHTHPVWSGDRIFEFDLKMKGASYLDIHSQGGGIYFTVRHTRESSVEDLLRLFLERLDLFLSSGTTVVEVKTGYGLDYETEKKMLKVISLAKERHPIEIVTTLLAAHAVPSGMDPEEATTQVIDIIHRLKNDLETEPEQLPAIDFVDVFCEKGVYSVEETKRILLEGRSVLNAELGFHGEELCCLDSAVMAGEIKARSISHCEYISNEGIEAISGSKTAAIICPTTAYILRLPPPPVRQMIEKGVIVALGSDFNPNAYCYSLPAAMNVGVIHCRMSLNEALVAATINSAYALNKSATHGSLEFGKVADFVLLNHKDWRSVIYQVGNTKDLIRGVFKRGRLVSGSSS